jgi:peptidoglycan/LPS O-acetylase OafA/YrhL
MRTRDRYIDFLRALALVRVVTYHTFGWVWLPVVFPSLGIMFALGGALVASSLDRAGSTQAFLRKRVRRLLPPFWLFGAAMIGIMLVAGWQADGRQGGVSLSWSNAWLWVLPLADPPASDLGYDWVVPLWYIRTYLWFLLLSPVLLWLFRRWPLRVMAVPVVVLPLMVLGLVDFADPYWDIVCQLCIYSCCWMLGFAHHDGKLRRLPLTRTLAGGAVLMGAGLWYALANQERYGSWNVDDIPIAGLLYFTGAVLILLRIYVRFTWLERLPTLDAVVSLINSRAMTIYLWGNFAIGMAPLALAHTPLGQYDTADARGMVVEYLAAWTLIVVAVLLFGWVEDVAATRRPRLLPWRRVKPVRVFSDASVPADVPADVVVPGSRTERGNFVVDGSRSDLDDFAAQAARSGAGTSAVLELSPGAVGAPAGLAEDVRANVVVDELTPEEGAVLAEALPARVGADPEAPDAEPGGGAAVPEPTDSAADDSGSGPVTPP